MFGGMHQDFKVELLRDLKTRGTTAVAELDDANLVGDSVNEVSVYKTGAFTDLCRGPHVTNTREIDPESFRLTRVSGAYWRGNQAREQMQRVYGVAFDTKKELEEYFVRLEEAKKRDHRKLGQELDLFSINPDTVGGGLILWHPKGGLIRHLAEEYCKKAAPRVRIRLRLYAAHRPRQSMGNERPSRLLRREHVRADQDRRAALLLEADELPVSRQHL